MTTLQLQPGLLTPIPLFILKCSPSFIVKRLKLAKRVQKSVLQVCKSSEQMSVFPMGFVRARKVTGRRRPGESNA